jgi:esterase/lipase superfamily enzyme
MTPAIPPRVPSVYAAQAIVQTGLEPDRQPCILVSHATRPSRWYSHRLSRDMGVNVYGITACRFLPSPPAWATSMSRRSGMVRRSAPTSSKGASDSFHQRRAERLFSKQGAHLSIAAGCGAIRPYVANKSSLHRLRLPDARHPIATLGASLGAYHAANTFFKHPTT